jgi:hypothetical protein
MCNDVPALPLGRTTRICCESRFRCIKPSGLFWIDGRFEVVFLNTPDDLRPFCVELSGVRLVRFLLAVFQTLALVVL